MFYVHVGIGFVDWLEKGFIYIFIIYIYEKSFEKNLQLLMTEFDSPEVTLWGWQAFQILNEVTL